MSIVEKAEEHISGYVTDKFQKAFARVDKEMHEKGCGCPSCKKNSVRDINEWTDFVSKGEPPFKYEVVNKCGKLKIRVKMKDETDTE